MKDKTKDFQRSHAALETVIALVRAALFNEGQIGDTDIPVLTADAWDEALRFASRQGVLPIVTSLFIRQREEDAATRQVKVKWFAVAQQNRQRYQIRLQTMREMASLFAHEGIDVMFFKGVQLAQLYPNPEWRVFSDIDYYLFGRSADGISVLAGKGIENEAYYHHHTQAVLHGVLLENHYDFVERVNHRCDILLDDALKALAAEEGHSIRASFLGEEYENAYVMTPTMNAIFLMRHMSAHFVGETVPLRQLYDWALFLQREGSLVDWKRVTDLYETSALTEFAGIVQALLHDRLHVVTPSCPVAPLRGERTEKVWQSIVSPPEADPYRKFSLPYFLFEARTFLNNRWKHAIVYPDDSYFRLFFRYLWSVMKKKLGLLKNEERSLKS